MWIAHRILPTSRFLCGIMLLWVCFSKSVLASAPDPSDVIVVANANLPESLELAQFYLRARAIPPENLIVLATSIEATVTRSQYVGEILHPLREQLLQRNQITGRVRPESPDASGRFAFQPFAADFKYLVLCKGIPLKIENVANHTESDLPENMPAAFRKTQASVDSELALVTAANQRWMGPIANPLFQIPTPSRLDYSDVVSVCRLDGPTLAHAKSLVTLALEAEAQPFVPGRAYIDLNHHHPDGNLWLREAATHLRAYGYDVDVIPAVRHWSFRDRHDAPAIYLGWYQTHAAGPMLNPQPIPKGAIGAHIHSFSAGTLQSTTQQWVGPLIDAGFAVTFGNVYEPYLQLTLRPDLFIDRLLRGACLGDAALYALPFVSWQHVTLGDPLYRPFRPASEWNPAQLLKTPDTDPYTYLVALNRIGSQDAKEAFELAFQTYLQSPSVPLAFHILEHYPQQLSATLRRLIQNSLASSPHIPSQQAILYLHTYHNLIDQGMSETAENLMNSMKANQHHWHPELQLALAELTPVDPLVPEEAAPHPR